MKKTTIILLFFILFIINTKAIESRNIENKGARALPFLNGFSDISVDNGLYYIKNNSFNRYLDLGGPSQNFGLYIDSNFYNGNIEKNFRIEKTSDDYYVIKSEYNNNYMGQDVLNQGLNKRNIVQYGAINQYTKWRIMKNNSNEIIFVPYGYSDRVLISTSVGATQLSNSMSYAKWTLYKQEEGIDGVVFIQNNNTRKYLYSPSNNNYAIFEQIDLNPYNYQTIDNTKRFDIESYGDTYYTIKNVYTNSYVGIDTLTEEVIQYSSISNTTKWKIYLINDCYQFVPYGYAPRTKAASVESGTNANGLQIKLLDYSNNRAGWLLYNGTHTVLGGINYWHSSANFVGCIFDNNSEIKIYSEYIYEMSFNSTFNNLFAFSVLHAVQEWGDALSDFIYFTETSVNTNSDIEIYGGTRADLGVLNSTYAGVTEFLNNPTLVGIVTYQNEIKEVCLYSKMEILVIDYDGNQIQNNIYNVTTHELGHAIGFAGHTSNDVLSIMNALYNTVSVSSIDIEHMYQVYDMYY